MTLKKIEFLIDKRYQETRLPHPNLYLAVWHFLTATEDALRQNICRNDISTGSIEYFVDRTKYSLKHGLERIFIESKDAAVYAFPRRVNEFCYGRGLDLLRAGIEYSMGSQICHSAHNGSVELRESEGFVILSIDEKHNSMGYAALEMMGHQPEDNISHMQIIFWLLQKNKDLPFIVDQIADSVSVKGKLISYEYDSYLAAELSLIFSQSPPLIPRDWEFSWGGRDETTLLLNSLSMRCAYHFIAIHFGAIAKGLSGGGFDDLVMTLSIEMLCHDIEKLSSLPSSKIQLFVHELIYGNGVKSPDPALQPFIRLGKDFIAVPPLHILSCYMERNLLTLQARAQRAKFDAMSSAFERDMIASTMQKILPHWTYIKPNFTWKFRGEKEEFDLIIADPESFTLLVCEMRWNIQPGDPREVEQRKKNCFQKVSQLHRKIEWLRPNLNFAISQIFGINSSMESTWSILGLVVVDGFGGVMSKNEDIPIIPVRIFERVMARMSSLDVLGIWSKSLEWLPQRDIFFKIRDGELELEGVRIKCEGMEPIQERSDYLHYIDKTIEAVMAKSQ